MAQYIMEMDAKTAKAVQNVKKFEDRIKALEKKLKDSKRATDSGTSSFKGFAAGAAKVATGLLGAMGVNMGLSSAIQLLKDYKESLRQAGEEQNRMAGGMMGLAVMNPQRVAEVSRTTAAVGASYGIMPDMAAKIVEPLQGMFGSFEAGIRAAIPAMELVKLGAEPGIAGEVIKYGKGVEMSPREIASLVGAAAEESGFTVADMAKVMPGLAEWSKEPTTAAAFAVEFSKLAGPEEAKLGLEKMSIALDSESELTREAALKMTGSFEKYMTLQKKGGGKSKEIMGTLADEAMDAWGKLSRIEKMREVAKTVRPEEGEDVNIAYLQRKGLPEIREARYMARGLRGLINVEAQTAKLRERSLDYNKEKIALLEQDEATAKMWETAEIKATMAMQTAYGPKAEKYREALTIAEEEAVVGGNLDPSMGVSPETGRFDTSKMGWLRWAAYQVPRALFAGGQTGGVGANVPGIGSQAPEIPIEERREAISAGTEAMQQEVLGGRNVEQYLMEIRDALVAGGPKKQTPIESIE